MMSVGHVLDHVPDHVLDHVPDHVLDYMIISLVATALKGVARRGRAIVKYIQQ